MGESKNEQCFVIMPISDPKDYESGHFMSVYEDIFIPAIKEAGYVPKRADDDKSSSMIQVNIIQDIVESPMAICDLSSKNPNVLFELGIRQAFDLPVVLVQEKGTPRIFDISTINTIDYGKELLYRNVMSDRKKIKEAILQTRDNSRGINSIVKLLGREPAKKKEGIDDNALLFTMSNQIQNIINKIDNLEIKKSKEDASQPIIPRLPVSDKRAFIGYQVVSDLEKKFQNVSSLSEAGDLLVDLLAARREIVSTEKPLTEDELWVLDKIDVMALTLQQKIGKRHKKIKGEEKES